MIPSDRHRGKQRPHKVPPPHTIPYLLAALPCLRVLGITSHSLFRLPYISDACSHASKQAHFVSAYISHVFLRYSHLSLYALFSRSSSFTSLHPLFGLFLPSYRFSHATSPSSSLLFSHHSSFLCTFFSRFFSFPSSLLLCYCSPFPCLSSSQPFPPFFSATSSLSSDVRAYPTPAPVNRYLFKHQTSCR